MMSKFTPGQTVDHKGMSLVVAEVRDGKAILVSYSGYGRYPIVQAVVDDE